MKKLSVIIPVYNVEDYVVKCIRSVKENNLPESDYEIIVVDDESPDDSVALIQKTFLNDSSIQIISQKNKGLGGARNTGIKAAQGKYLLFLDSDDALMPNVLQEVLTIAEKNTLEIVEVGVKGIDLNGKEKYAVQNSSQGEILRGVEYYNSIRQMNNSACNKLYNRKFLLENQLFFLERIFIEDFEFNTRAYHFAQKTMGIPTVLIRVLLTDNSITRNASPEKKQKMVTDIHQVLKITNLLFQKSNLKDAEVNNFFQERLGFLVATLVIQKVKNKASYSEIKQLKEQLEQEGMYFINHTIYKKSKDIFRMLILKHIYVYKLIRPFL